MTQRRNLVQEEQGVCDGGDLPARSISWSDCQTFCEVTALTIPTEAQWEYACRAGTTADFAFGESITNNQVNYAASYDTPKGQYRGKAVPVNSFKPNGFGLYNMHGNVSEWCHDTYDAEFYSKPEAVLRDPLSTSGSEEKVARGGSWGDSSKVCRSAFRLGVDPSGRYDRFGFRPAYYPLP